MNIISPENDFFLTHQSTETSSLCARRAAERGLQSAQCVQLAGACLNLICNAVRFGSLAFQQCVSAAACVAFPCRLVKVCIRFICPSMCVCVCAVYVRQEFHGRLTLRQQWPRAVDRQTRCTWGAKAAAVSLKMLMFRARFDPANFDLETRRVV